MKLNIKRGLALTTILTASSIASAQDYDKTVMERVMVIGTAENAQNIAGSAQFIGKEQLDKNNYTDINRVLRQVPGVNLQEEEGYGNRPNIGIRGGRSERSADITLMEDGILIAPAPYASPSAYYFPRVNRMEAVEVRKGSSTIKFGPRTTSGAVNLISSSVPDSQKGEVLVGAGSHNTKRVEGQYGNSYKVGDGSIGFVVDASHDQTDGFKDIDIVGGDSGYSIQDFNGKIKYSTNPSDDVFQSFELKIGATEEDSDETYLGLTQADFNADPYRRYASTQKDNMAADHQQYHLRHFIDFGGDIDVTTTAYHNQFSRNWYKLDDITIGGTRKSLSAALDDSAYLDALKGNTNLDGSAANNLTLRNNNRDYYATGVQTDIAKYIDVGNTKHKIEAGARYHYDKEDRFQHEDLYSINNGVMALASSGAPGSNANRHATAKAVALYVQDEIKFNDWTITPGVRYEHIDLKREDFNSDTIKENSVSEIIPGLGVNYAVNDNLNIFGGVHKGFAPPAPGSTDDENEESVNYELGARYNKNGLNTEVTGYYSDYSNLLGDCTFSSGCTGGSVGDQFNAGEVEAYGVEISAGYDAAKLVNAREDIKLPVSLNYTYTKAEFKDDFTSNFDEWGTVTAGDELPYIPENQFYVSAGIEAPKWQFNLAGKYIDEMRTQAGSGAIPAGQGTDANFVVDAAGEYEVYKNARVFATVDNLFDEEYVAARRPAGARPGKPLTAVVGVKYKF